MADISYITDSFEEKIRRVNEIGAPVNFLFITDEHNRLHEYSRKKRNPDNPQPYELASNAIEAVRYVIERCPSIQFVVNGGDIGNDYAPDYDDIIASYREVYDGLYSLPLPVHCVIGNHDDMLGNAIDHGRDTRIFKFLPDEMHEMCMKYNPTPENYYYVDDKEHGFRYVFMNTSDRPYFTDESGQYVFGWRIEVSTKQAQWLENEALKTDLNVIVFSHAPLHNEGLFGTEGMPDGIKPYDDLLGGPRVYHDIKVSENVIANISGHVHFDNLIYDGDLIRLTSLDSFADEWAPNSPKRTIGTHLETAFDVFSLKDGVMYITRFGAGEDRVALMKRYKESK
ncbi:MAG: metallophosphoesterase [Firmicutes bacterium]|nr:metallophosphoesterase [Candidatus Colimorpha enterica]